MRVNFFKHWTQLVIHMVFIVDHIYNLMNEYKIFIFVYNNNQIMSFKKLLPEDVSI